MKIYSWIGAFSIMTALTVAVQAHHSFVGHYDATKKITLKGVVTSVEYMNPHIFFMMSVPRRGGGTQEWRIETESILMTRGRGLKKNKLVPGKRVQVTGWASRGGALQMGLSSIRFGRGGTIVIRRRAR